MNTAYFASSLIQAGSAYYKQRNRAAFEKISRFDVPFRLANIGSLFYAGLEGAAYFGGSRTSYFLSALICAGATYSARFAIKKLNEKMIKSSESPLVTKNLETEGLIIIEKGKNSPSQKSRQAFLLIQLISSIALMIFSKTLYLFALSSIAGAYSLYAATKEKWMKIALVWTDLQELLRRKKLNELRAKEAATTHGEKLEEITLSFFLPNISGDPTHFHQISTDYYYSCDKDSCRKACHNKSDAETMSFDAARSFHPTCFVEQIKNVHSNLLATSFDGPLLTSGTKTYHMSLEKDRLFTFPYDLPQSITQSLKGKVISRLEGRESIQKYPLTVSVLAFF